MQQAISQTEKFDIATYTPPKGWKCSTGEGYVSYQDSKKSDSAGSFCILVVYASRQGTGDADKDFAMEWKDLVEKPNDINVKPETQKEQTTEGWTAVSGATTLKEGQQEYSCMLVSVSGQKKVMSVLVKLAGQDYLKDVESFLTTMQLDAKSVASNNTTNTKQSNSSKVNPGSLIGIWNDNTTVAGSYVNSSGAYTGDASIGSYTQYEFKADNTFTYIFQGVSSSMALRSVANGTYKIDGDNLILITKFYKGGYANDMKEDKSREITEVCKFYIGPNKWNPGPFLNLHRDGTYYMWSDFPYDYYNKIK